MKKYDLIISIGRDCACSSYLRNNDLQLMSYPFDWLTNATLSKRFELILTDFKDFINIEDLKKLEEDCNRPEGSHYDHYENLKNGIHFYHDFPSYDTVEEAFPTVKEKYSRRINRLLNDISTKEKVLLIWLSHSGRDIDDSQLINYSEKINKKFGKQIDIFVIDNDPNIDEDSYKSEKISQSITKFTANTYTASPKNITLGNEKICTNILLQNIQLNTSKLLFIKKRVRNKLFKFLSAFFVNKEKRKKFRRKYIRK